MNDMVYCGICDKQGDASADEMVCTSDGTPDGSMWVCDDGFGCAPERVAEMEREMRAAYREWLVSPQRLERELEDARRYGAL